MSYTDTEVTPLQICLVFNGEKNSDVLNSEASKKRRIRADSDVLSHRSFGYFFVFFFFIRQFYGAENYFILTVLVKLVPVFTNFQRPSQFFR